MPTRRLRQTARALLLDQNDRLLLARHDLTARHIGAVVWAPPGGGLDPGETPFDAALRELNEEVGYEASGEELTMGVGITEFRWWTLADMDELPDPEEFRPRHLPALLRDLLNERVDQYPIDI